MAGRLEQHKAKLINVVADKFIKQDCKIDPNSRGLFARTLLSGIPPEDLANETEDNLLGMVNALWQHTLNRSDASPKISLCNPDLDSHGWQSPHTAVMVLNDDMPFLVDSINAELSHLDMEVYLIIHPVFFFARDDKGNLKKVEDPDGLGEGQRESLMLVLVGEQDEARHADIAHRLELVLADVRHAVEDWRDMRQRTRDLIRDLEKAPPRMIHRQEVDDAVRFLEWVDNDHFTYLGYREYRFEGEGDQAVARIQEDTCLGVLRDPAVSVFHGLRNLGMLPPDVQAWVKRPELLRVTKTNRRSTVHRPAHMDAVAMKIMDRTGKVIGERLIVGLFTSTAYSRSPRSIPLLRRKIDNTIARAGFVPGSHDGKALLHILETYPRDELFQISEEELSAIAIGVLNLQERQRTAIFVRHDPFERFVSCMVYVPRDRFDTSMRLKLQEKLAKTYDGTVVAFSTQLGDSPLARLHLIVNTTQGAVPAVDLPELEKELAEMTRSWADRLRQALIEAQGEGKGLALWRRYEQAFPSNYKEAFFAKDAVADILRIEEALASNDLAMDLYRPFKAAPEVLHFKLYVPGTPIPLSDVLPMLENMGLKVIGEVPYEVFPDKGAQSLWVHDFHMTLQSGGQLEIEKVRNAFHEVFSLVWHGSMDNDGFNRLVLVAGLTAQEIRILRAYCKYLRQAQIPFSQEYMENTLARNPELAAKLCQLFELRFDPAQRKALGKTKAKAEEEQLTSAILAQLDQVTNLDEDRIVRRYLNLIQVTLRTNYYQLANGAVKDYVSFKFDAANIEELPQPRPYREIFVYSPRVEGVHLRFGPVARGGLRWSDRREDFRTEILGLVKAQQVKNAVIVPVGSKGGFVPKRPVPPEAGRDAWLAEGVACYKIFLSGLLDVTDNLKGDKVVPPKSVVRYDQDDPYLVVAADKGTATFSDYANGVSNDYGFWLDDAFASGGSAGYDHKAMGITARGAWESVKRHFRELRKDIQKEEFTAIGVGDMSGDVFGNGMLLSRKTRLLAAFNHLHIFVDPNPDAEKSWVERKRLFDLPRSNWADYDSKLVSKGGGIFDRKAKSIKLSAEIKKTFGITQDSLTPNELIRAILVSQVELLWFGGIGTYIKAESESHADVGDRASDPLRINGKDLQAKVVGEGANLGMTQLGRVEAALRGVRLNTDAIDNSAGVDCSDHEVNIKVLLGAAEECGKLTRKQRDSLLEKMTDEVAELVLRDNYMQSQSLTVTHQLGAHLLDRLGRFMRTLERSGQLDRALEFLPDDETMTERFNAGLGLTRPELSVLLSYAKIALYGEVLESDLPDDTYLEADLINYFPKPLHKKYKAEIEGHRLRREIITTLVTNSVVNRMGIAFVHEVKEKTGMPSAEITRAFIAAREIFDMRAVWRQIEALDNKVPATVQSAMLIECGRLLERIAVWLLRHKSGPLDIAQTVKTYRSGVSELVGSLSGILHEVEKKRHDQEVAHFKAEGVPAALAKEVASLKLLVASCDIVRTAQQAKLPVMEAAKTYFAVGDHFGFDWLRRAASRLPSDSGWDKLAVTAIMDDLFGLQYDVVASILATTSSKSKAGTRELIAAWTADRATQVARSDQLLAELQVVANPDLAMLAVANRQLKSLL
ncbi:NAD-glutamate dehydrogenase [Rhodovibrionaceae bacterium A322]